MLTHVHGRPLHAAAISLLTVLGTACGGSGDDATTTGGNALSGSGATSAPPATSTAPGATATSGAPSFEGQWTAEFTAPGADGTAIAISYVVTVHGGDVLFTADGFQTMVRVNAKGTVSGSDLLVTFDSCGADDQFKCSTETQSEPLFHLHQVAGKTTLAWDKFPGEGTDLPATLTDKSPWSGTWQAEFTAPGADGTSIAISYVVAVAGGKVTFSADGFQTMARMNATGTLQGDDLSVVFDSCGADDQFQCASQTKGDELFHLHRDGQKPTIVWDKFLGEGSNLPLALAQ